MMMRIMTIRRLRGLLGAAACALAATVAFTGSSAFARPAALGTAFTYQGQLKQGGSAYSGTAELRFRLYDALTAGNQIGLQIALTSGNAPTVTLGLFNVTLDFGLDGNGFPAISGEARWLEIDVRTTGAGAFTTLSPRQALTATPYALVAQHALTTNGIVADATGFVGIGTSSPETQLHVHQGSAGAVTGFSNAPLVVESSSHTYINILSPAAQEQGILFGNPTDGPAAGGVIYDNAQTPNGLQFRTNGNINRMVIDQNGSVGIGMTLPVARLHCVSAFHAGWFECSGSNTVGVTAISTGPAGVGVRGSGSGFDFLATGTGIDYGTASSIRWKHNIELIADPLEKVAAMRGVYFDWDADHGGQRAVGFIGEEVGKLLPEVVVYEKDSEFVAGMDYGKLTPLLVEAVKALRAEKDAQIEQQQEQIIALQQDNQELRHRLAAIEATIAQIAVRHSR